MKKILLSLISVLAITGSHGQSGTTNLDFENWSGGAPVGFVGLGISQQTTGAQHGSSFARITINTATGSTADGALVLGASLTAIGAPYTLRPVSVSGYYRSHLINSTDTMGMMASLTQNHTAIASEQWIQILNETMTWTPFQISFNYVSAGTPDTLNLIFIANKYLVSHIASTAGDYLDIDNMTIDLSTGIPGVVTHVPLVAYPNPAKNSVRIESDNSSARFVRINDATGRLIQSVGFLNGSLDLDLTSFSNGLYFYTLVGDMNQPISQNRFVVAK